MDLSDRYIEMCRQAKEIQKRREHAISYSLDSPQSFFRCAIHDVFFVIPYLGDDTGVKQWFPQEIWLPRQDQLQDMIDFPEVVFSATTEYFCNLRDFGDPLYMVHPMPGFSVGYWRSFQSLEQFWLAMVMACQHRKHWNGKEWVCQSATLT